MRKILDTTNKIGEKTPSITLSQLRKLIEVVLPVKHYDIAATLELVCWIQEKNHRAYLSHRKKKLGRIKELK